MNNTSASPNVSIAALTRFFVEALRRTGMSEQDAVESAEVLATTDAWGIFTHGCKNFHGYLRRLFGGGLNPTARPAIAAEGPAWAIVDGHSALGMVTSLFATRVAIARARTHGIAYVGVRNSCHFGAAGYYAWLAAKEGLIGIAMANDIPSVTAPGAREAITGSNPLAYAVPAGKHPPIILDMAISTAAGGKVFAARQLGKSIPDNWIVGPDGRPTTDPSLFPEKASLLPSGGHKGYGLALLIETLSALLSGAQMTWAVRRWMQDDPSLATGHGAAFIVIDVQSMTPTENFRARVDALIDEIHAAPKAVGSDRIMVPGEREWENYQRAQVEGIALPPDALDAIRIAAEHAGMDPASLYNRNTAVG
jgi:ureidoglycolate dehydrogenase (NAD+)